MNTGETNSEGRKMLLLMDLEQRTVGCIIAYDGSRRNVAGEVCVGEVVLIESVLYIAECVDVGDVAASFDVAYAGNVQEQVEKKLYGI